MKKLITIISVLLLAPLFAQGITTASAYFKTISERYANIHDYEADFDISVNGKATSGKLSYRVPDLVRLDYTRPRNQVICYNGEALIAYLPGSAAVLQQTVDTTASRAARKATKGLGLLSRYYSVAYETGQSAVPLYEGSSEMVIKFILYRRNASETFRHIKIAVNPRSKLIRRIEAVTPNGEKFIFNFYNYRLNQDIPELRFIYDPPSDANVYNNFLYSE